ncbi:translocator protein homolog [Magnolia sinica]|uniref:translocator protein homolog n=1 Tax=Magnolia sinica TaxID=86752 RepID=UPI00265943B9|nr:translocator protein homolog [Magnolia sinica]
MASQTLKQRLKDDPTTITTTNTNTTRNTRSKKIAMARRGLKSLAVAILVPFSLTIATIFACRSIYNGPTGPVPYIPMWAIHLASLSSSCLMGLSGWLVWAEGGFHQQPLALALYVAQFVLGLFPGPLVFAKGATRAGLLVCGMLFVSIYGCSWCFRRVNPIAADLVKPTLAWVAFLGVMNYKLL